MELQTYSVFMLRHVYCLCRFLLNWLKLGCAIISEKDIRIYPKFVKIITFPDISISGTSLYKEKREVFKKMIRWCMTEHKRVRKK